MDFIEGLLKSKTYDTILVVIDELTKYAHFICLSHPYTAITVAHAFLTNIYKFHGIPTVIIFDRDSFHQLLLAKNYSSSLIPP